MCKEVGCEYQTPVKRNLKRHHYNRHTEKEPKVHTGPKITYDCHICDATLGNSHKKQNHKNSNSLNFFNMSHFSQLNKFVA